MNALALRVPRALPVLVLVLLCLAPWTARPLPAEAATLTFQVNSTVDAPDARPGDGVCATLAGQCTLRAAIQEANAQPSGSTITVSVPAGIYPLPLGLLSVVSNTIILKGAGAARTVVSGLNRSQVLSIAGTATAALMGMTIFDGNNAGAGGNGGGIANAGRLLVVNSAVISNTASGTGTGGGIYNAPSAQLWLLFSLVRRNSGSGISNDPGAAMTVIYSTLSGNTSNDLGGGIANHGILALSTSTLSGNTSNDFGGGIYNNGTLTLSTSILNGNMATGGSGEGAGSGGGIYNSGSLTVSTSALISNTATDGGGIYNHVGTVTLTKSTLSGNTATDGGGIYNDSSSTLRLTNSTLSGNTATDGGGIYNYFGTVMLTNSTLSGNSVTSGGGGIYNNGTLTLSTSALISNTTLAGGFGGGIYNNLGTVGLTNSTLSGNTASSGGGIYNSSYLSSGSMVTATVMLSYTTVATNSSGLFNDTGVGLGPATIALTGTMVANSTAGSNCTGPITEGQGDNLDSGTSCGFSQPTDLSNTDPLLGPPANNGGPTQTMALFSGSPAIDRGSTSATGCPATDQRGLPRPDEVADNGACDIGAYESQGVG